MPLRIVDGYYSERFLETSLPFLRCCAVLPYGHSNQSRQELKDRRNKDAGSLHIEDLRSTAEV
jgi:hypothetical protein